MSEQDDPIATIAAGYAVTGPALELGAAVVEGTACPQAGVRVPLAVLNRHGLVAGATGTGKTKTLQLIAEQLSAQGVPVFLADVKGDLSGISAPGEPGERVAARAAEVGQDWQPAGCPVEFYALGGIGTGVPIRATITDFGPTLLAKVLDLNDTQESSLGLIFHFADERGLELVDLKDLRAVIQYLTDDQGKAELKKIGGLSAATAGVILRALITLENNGGGAFFGEPNFDTADLLRTTPGGHGLVSVLELAAVQDKPQLFSTFLMWLLADLFHDLPEVGDLDRPRLVFFFDEAHLLFTGASKAFLTAITQTVRLIRSKGVGIFFVTQTPRDVPADVLSQLGNRVQHALRAFTPEDAKALKATVSTFPRSAYDLDQVLTQAGTGEAVVTVLSEKGAPTPVAWTRLRAPTSLMAPIPAEAMRAAVAGSALFAKYGTAVDRESAFEKLTAAQAQPAVPDAAVPEAEKAGKAEKPEKAEKTPPGVVEQVMGNTAVKSMLRSMGTQLGREISRSLFGTARRKR
ncbi:helicase HerA-like domain-containing protein [Embleya sp. AB8]|uniref:helicase HerA-like domain-containing protein n=1 Tax=Embleya sp. AB8 TaxID=3156304 RepID=UPI003C7749CB